MNRKVSLFGSGALIGLGIAFMIFILLWIVVSLGRGHGISPSDLSGWELTIVTWHLLWVLALGALFAAE